MANRTWIYPQSQTTDPALLAQMVIVEGVLNDIYALDSIVAREAQIVSMTAIPIIPAGTFITTLTADAKVVKYVNNSGFYISLTVGSATIYIAAGAAGEAKINEVIGASVDAMSFGQDGPAGLDGSSANSGVLVLNFEG